MALESGPGPDDNPERGDGRGRSAHGRDGQSIGESRRLKMDEHLIDRGQIFKAQCRQHFFKTALLKKACTASAQSY